MKTLKTTNLSDLVHDVAYAWVRQQAYAFDRSEMMYDCSMFDLQSASKEEQLPDSVNNGRASWSCLVTTDCGCTWYNATLSIPAWLYKYYVEGRASFISWRQVEADVLDLAFEM